MFVGFAKLNNRTAESKLSKIFEAYKENNFFNISEVVNIIHVPTGSGLYECFRYAPTRTVHFVGSVLLVWPITWYSKTFSADSMSLSVHLNRSLQIDEMMDRFISGKYSSIPDPSLRDVDSMKRPKWYQHWTFEDSDLE